MALSVEDLQDAAAILTHITEDKRIYYPTTVLSHWDQTSTRYNLRRNRSQWLNGHKIDLSWIQNAELRELIAAKITEVQMAGL